MATKYIGEEHMIRDEFHSSVPDDPGMIHFARIGDRLVAKWDGINPIYMTTELFEDMDWGMSKDIERLPNNSFRICQYRFELIGENSRYKIYEVDEYPNEGVPQEYRDRLAEWEESQGLVKG